MRKWLIALLVVGVVLVGPASAAQAVESMQTSRTADVPDFTPSGSKWREYMLNVTSKILRGASGGRLDVTGSWKAEMIANQYRYEPSAEQLNRMYGASSYNPNYATKPDTYEDYVLREQTRATRDGGRKLKVQSTLGSKLMKGAGVLSAFTFVPLIGGLGSDVYGGWLGFDDTDAEFCRADAQAQAGGGPAPGWFSTGLGLLSGRDCSMFTLADGYLPNADVDGDISPLVHGGLSIVYLGQQTKSGNTQYCYQASASTELPVGSYWRYPSVSPSSVGGYQYASVFNTYDAGSLCSAFPGANAYFYVLYYGVQGATSPLVQLVNRGDPGDAADDDVLTGFQESSADPERYIECVVTLDNGDVLTSQGDTYTEGSGALKMPPCPSVPEGRHATNISLVENRGDGTGSTLLYDEDTTPEYQDWATSFPECAEGACALDLRMKNGDKLGASCFDLPDGCPDWFEDPEKASKYQCTYGANQVDLDECTVYAGLFQPGRVAVGGAYSDPMTGEWTGGSNSVTLDRQAMAQKVQNPASTRSCNGLGGGGFDPVGFVMRPIQCALEWAFVPRPLVVEAQLAGGGEAWEGKPPAVIAAAVANAAPSAAVEGCSRTVTIFTGQFETTLTPLNACPGSWSAPLAVISKIATSGLMAVLVFVVVRRQISGMVGYNQGQ